MIVQLLSQEKYDVVLLQEVAFTSLLLSLLLYTATFRSVCQSVFSSAFLESFVIGLHDIRQNKIRYNPKTLYGVISRSLRTIYHRLAES